jgi:hypothetical protein
MGRTENTVSKGKNKTLCDCPACEARTAAELRRGLRVKIVSRPPEDVSKEVGPPNKPVGA